MMRLLQNSILLSTIAFVGLFWAMDYILGTAVNRDMLDYISLFVSALALFRYGPAAWRNFVEGRSGEAYVQLQIGNVIFWSGINVQSIWQLAYRAAERPEWMQLSPWNGAFKAWIVWGGILCIRATIENPLVMPRSVVWVVLLALFSGIIIGFAGARFFGMLG